ncbi:hypothetical protein GCM10020367_12720 [Streptomyces sannanensis]|uniref:LysM domain-containing protein n=1 Tax=Streptomyces sannanensis TaxID=285536 RepID=A0ABP6S6R7_9ACTN
MAQAPQRAGAHTGRSATWGNHTVRSGDTLSAIAAAHNTTWQALHALNRAVIGPTRTSSSRDSGSPSDARVLPRPSADRVGPARARRAACALGRTPVRA